MSDEWHDLITQNSFCMEYSMGLLHYPLPPR